MSQLSYDPAPLLSCIYPKLISFAYQPLWSLLSHFKKSTKDWYPAYYLLVLLQYATRHFSPFTVSAMIIKLPFVNNTREE